MFSSHKGEQFLEAARSSTEDDQNDSGHKELNLHG